MTLRRASSRWRIIRRDVFTRRSAQRNAFALRLAIAELPVALRRTMLEAVQAEDEVIVGGYADRGGRVCPMLAAQRRGARAAVGAFPGAWDRFAGVNRPRTATRREREILVALLQESLAGEPAYEPAAPEPACVG